ncbi:MAG: MarC family protein [Thermoprotei archaeon]
MSLKRSTWQRWLEYSQSKTLRRALLIVVLILLGLFAKAIQTHSKLPFSFNPTHTAYIVVELVAIIDPIGALPTFMVFLSDVDQVGRRRVVETMTGVVLALMLFFALLGQPLLQLLGVNVTSFQFGGGIILLYIAIDMLGHGSEGRKIDLSQVAVVPLATPLLVGPGTMTALIVLTNQQSVSLLDVLIGCVASTLIVYLTFYFSEYIFRLLGQNGVKAISRLFTIILAAIAAQMIHNALLGWGVAKF